MPYLLIVEDHPLMAEAIGTSLWRWLPALQLRRAFSWAEVTDLTGGDREPPVFIVTDLQLPDSQPAQTLKRLRQAYPQIPILVLTMLDDVDTQALSASHNAQYLCKSAAPDMLRQTLQEWLGPENWAQWSIQPAPLAHPLQGFSSRQQDILKELANGRSNREIGAMLHISEDTVRSHVKTLFARLGVKNRTQASKFYLQNKIAQSPPGL